MGFLTGSPKGSWEPIMTANTTARSYWVNWRFLACAVCLLVSGICATLVILKHEGSRNSRPGNAETQRHEEPPGIVYEDETWRPCIKGIHPAWLLAFRAVAFCVLFSLLVLSAVTDGASIFYYYTQWTVTSITIYFGLGCVLSMCGCYRHHKKASGDKVDNVEGDAEQGTYDAPGLPRISDDSVSEKTSAPPVEDLACQPAGIWGYIFQVTFQINAGAVLLTDCVYWFVLFPFLTMKHFNLNLITVCMHTVNVVFLLGDTAFNSLRFPWFRIGYFYMWTFTYVVFLWIIHTCVDLWWPYPFLDLSSPFAPLWYFSVALLLIPCYGIFVLIMKLKHHLLSTRFPDSYQWRR